MHQTHPLLHLSDMLSRDYICLTFVLIAPIKDGLTVRSYCHANDRDFPKFDLVKMIQLGDDIKGCVWES